MTVLTSKQVLSLHSNIIKATGGTDGIRDNGLLDSALNAPFQTFGGTELYPSLIQKAARLGYAIISNHPFLDGNKRTGIHTMLVFLELNGVIIECSQKELVKIGLSLADGTMDAEALLLWLSMHN